MLLSLSVLLWNSKRCLTCAPNTLSGILRKFKYRKNTNVYHQSDLRCKQNSKDSLMKDLAFVNVHRHYHDKERTPQVSYHMCRDYQTISKKDSFHYHTRKLLRMNRSALLNYSLPQSHSDTEMKCRAYSTRSVNETLTEWTEKLETASVPEARLSAEHIIAHILGVPRKELSVLGGSHLPEDVASEAERLMTCRLARMPLQYIIGDWDFHSVTIKVRPPVFIPRPETEQLVDLALECLQGIQRPRVLDIGCGSGAISLALLKNISDLKCVALDHSKHAIELTEENAALLGVRQRLTLIHEKVTLEKMPRLPYDEFDLIVSNPPYVLRKDLMDVQPEIMIYEDMRALDGGKEGMDVVQPILLHFQHVLSVGKYLLLEVDPCHQYLVPAWMDKQQKMKIKLSEVLKDFEGKHRFLKFVRMA